MYAVPEGLSAKEAAPLMCAGLTVFTALYQAQLPPTAHVAVVGIGGLGHLALQFARAWGFHVTAISHSPVSHCFLRNHISYLLRAEQKR